MEKKTKIIIAIAVVAIIAVAIIIFAVSSNSGNGKTNLAQVNSEEDLSNLLDKVYEGVSTELYSVQTISIDLTDETSVKSYTGLENGQDLEYAIVSEPMINAQPYSLVMAKVKSGVNANEVAKAMSEGVNPRKWICVTAKKLYATNSGDIVFLIMTNEEMSKGVYESFKALAGTIGEEYERTTEDEELPPDMSFPLPL